MGYRSRLASSASRPNSGERMNRQHGGIGAAALMLVLTVAVAAASAVVLVQVTQGNLSAETFSAAIQQCGWCFAALLGGPLLLGIVGAMLAGMPGGGGSETAAAKPAEAKGKQAAAKAAPAPPSTDAA